MFKNVKLRPKLLTVGILMTLVPLVLFGIFVLVQNRSTLNVSVQESEKLATTDLDHIAEGVYRMAETQNDLLKEMLTSYLNMARAEVDASGGIAFATEQISWNAMNQYTKNTVQVRLPKMLVGNTWFGKTTDLGIEVPVVDKIKKMARTVTCTIFQRMNGAGDILRIATNVEKLDGTRAIGTYIPHINPDGNANPVVATIMKGQTYVGRAYVVNGWYITAYEPIYDRSNNIVGVLYVGVPQESVASVRQAVMNIKVGTTGYVYVLDSQGHYVISQNGKRDGEDIWEAKDADGRLFIQEIVNKARALKPGEFAEVRYPWKNPGDPVARVKVARLLYYEPWDWVIGAGSYVEEFLEGANTIERMGRRSNMVLIGVIVGALFLATLIWLVISKGIADPIVNIARAVNQVATTRDLTLEVPVESQDEVGTMASEFNNMLRLLNDSFMLVSNAARNVISYATDVAQRASANKERAVNQEQQMLTMQSTVTEMRSTAGEVAETSESQRDAANESNTSIVELVKNMQSIADASRSQVEEANVSTERVGEMGETGAKVVQTAREQEAQVVNVNSAVEGMGQSVVDLTTASKRAMEFAQSALQAVEEGSHSVNATVEGMRAISESSDQISEIINVITEIAEQTNLLSLNAAIEAARAGEHGKGFAVVADEVGKLATRSSEAAKEITKLIKDSTERVLEGTKLSDQSRLALEKIAEGGGTNMKAIEEISAAADNLSSSLQNVTGAMEDLNKLAGEIAGMAGQQGERREAAQNALAALVEKATTISELIAGANKSLNEVGDKMSGVVQRSDSMKSMTDLQAGRSQTLMDITDQSAQASKATVEGASTVVDITAELEKLSQTLNEQVAQFKLEDTSNR